MGRAPRAQFPGALYHVYARGNRRERLFLDDDDYQSYIEALNHTATRLGVAVLAYCLMPNHPHLCVRTDGTPLSVFMQRINTRHARRFNNKYALRGHLHEGRYRALLVDEAIYLLRLVRYIHQNPVRAGLTATLEAWAYSSHNEYLSPNTWVAREPVLAHFSSLADYQAFANQPSNTEDADTFSKAGRGFRYAGAASAVAGVTIAVQKQQQGAPLLWLPLGRCQVEAPQTIEAEAEQWLTDQGAAVSLLDVQSGSLVEPYRRTRRRLIAFLRERHHSLRTIALLLNRGVPAISRLLTRENVNYVKSGT
jgi:REP element-mobilizing transposase RayT